MINIGIWIKIGIRINIGIGSNRNGTTQIQLERFEALKKDEGVVRSLGGDKFRRGADEIGLASAKGESDGDVSGGEAEEAGVGTGTNA
eukprot:CAMPEP_0175060342 /NCGR_PEP_ID=MMETSP0052_2-20121109/12958_1 /TAXON_ID=51329 ORGANISM="Polytomella parva, Strain SAG 63-3" /NCGR_SAMPLE_ID=MMETSP0052_2 /ASSEMBLY_ACC=CAM_ASM_000194 /LENGTH=87 /DNA_ID=CAMNT_0016326039 /DNA_START=113 /DNA_END=377 /DNA_ORIENTATION=+